MAVYFAAGLMTLFYLIMLPVRAGIAWHTGSELRAGITIGGLRFSTRGSIKYGIGTGLMASLTHDRSGKVHTFDLMQSTVDSDSIKTHLSAAAPAVKYLLCHVKPWRLKAHVHLCLPNAAHTAFVYGFLRTTLTTLHALRPELPLEQSVSADFTSGHTQISLCGILSCRFGHIMAAALILCRDYLSGRLHSWTANSQSKAS